MHFRAGAILLVLFVALVASLPLSQVSHGFDPAHPAIAGAVVPADSGRAVKPILQVRQDAAPADAPAPSDTPAADANTTTAVSADPAAPSVATTQSTAVNSAVPSASVAPKPKPLSAAQEQAAHPFLVPVLGFVAFGLVGATVLVGVVIGLARCLK